MFSFSTHRFQLPESFSGQTSGLFKKRSFKRFGQAGVSLVEYILCGMLCLVVLIPTVGFLGTVLKGNFSGMVETPKAQAAIVSISSASTATVKAPPPVAPGDQESSGPSGNPGGGTVTLTVDGATITLPNYPKDISVIVEAAGANGTTTILSDQR